MKYFFRKYVFFGILKELYSCVRAYVRTRVVCYNDARSERSCFIVAFIGQPVVTSSLEACSNKRVNGIREYVLDCELGLISVWFQPVSTNTLLISRNHNWRSFSPGSFTFNSIYRSIPFIK